MAQKYKSGETDFDDFNFDDDEFKIDMSGDEEAMAKGPLRRLATSFAKGAGESATSTQSILRFLGSALPEGYGNAISVATTAYDGLGELYDHAKESAEPAIPALKKAAEKLSKIQRLPEKWRDQLAEFSKQERGYASYDPNAEEIASTISEVFGRRFEEQGARDEVQGEKTRVALDRQTRIGAKGSLLQARLLDQVRHQTQRIADYQDEVTARYQRKSLELKYRQLHTLRDMLDLQRRSFAEQIGNLKLIASNTAWPETAKQGAYESKQSGFKSLASKLTNSFRGQAAQFTENFTRKMFDNIRSGLGSSISMQASALSAADSMMGMMDGMGGDDFGMRMASPTEMAAEGIGGGIADYLSSLLASRLQPVLSRNKKLVQGGQWLDYNISSAPQQLGRFARNFSYDDSTAMTLLRSLARSFIPTTGANVNVAGSPFMTAKDAVAFDDQTRRSIVEVIPGYLSRMLQEMTSMRTGKEVADADRVVYSLERGRFSTLGATRTDAQRRLMDDSKVKQAGYTVQSVMENLDPNEELSPKARAEILKQIMMDSIEGTEEFRPERFTSDRERTVYLTPETREEFARVVSPKLMDANGKPDWQKINQINRGAREFQETIPDMRSVMQAYTETGQHEQLSGLSFYNESGYGRAIDYDKFVDRIMDATAQNNDLGNRPSGPKPFDPTDPNNKPADILRNAAESLVDRALGRKPIQPSTVGAATAAQVDDTTVLHPETVVEQPTTQTGAAWQRLKKRFAPAVDKARELNAKLTGRVTDALGNIDSGIETVKTQIAELGQKTKTQADTMAADVLNRVDELAEETIDGVSSQGPRNLRLARRLGRRRVRGLLNRGRTAQETARTRLDELSEQGRIAKEDAREKIQAWIDENKADDRPWWDRAKSGLTDTFGATRLYLQNRFSTKPSGEQAPPTSSRGWFDRFSWSFNKDQQPEQMDLFDGKSNQPLLQAVKMQMGHYRDQLDKSRIIRSLDDIRGPVVDEANRVVLSAKDLASGVYDATGKKLTDITQRAKLALTEQARAWKLPGFTDEAEATPGAAVPGDGLNLDPLLAVNREQVELLQGILTAIMNQESGTADGEGPARRGWFERIFGKFGVGVGRTTGGLAKAVMGVYTQYLKGAGALVGAGFSAIGGTLKGIGSLGSMLAGGVGDVYIQGQKDPVLLASKMRKGVYLDAKQKVISSMRSLRNAEGPIIDTSDNGNIVLTIEQLQAGLFDTRGQRIALRFTRGLGRGIMGIAGGYATLAALPFRAITWGAKSIRSMITAVTELPDLFLPPNLDAPRLQVVALKAGEYYSGDTFKDARRMSHWRDIHGPIYNRHGQEVVSREDLPKLVMRNGQPYRSIASRLLGLATTVVGAPMRLAGAVYRGMFNVAGAGVTAVFNTLTGLLGRIGGIFNKKIHRFDSEKLYNVVERIYSLLDERLPGAKPREGSWQDQMAEQAEREKEKKEEKEQIDADRKSPMSRLMGWLNDKRKSMFGGGEEEEEDEGGDGDTTIISGGGDGDGKREKRGTRARNRKARQLRRQRAGKVGMFSKIGGAFKKIPGLGRLKLGGGLAGTAAMTLGGAAAVNALGGEDSTAGKAVSTTLGVAGTALTASTIAGWLGLPTLGAAVTGAGGVIGSAAMGAGSLLAGLLSSPVVLGAAALGAVAYGGMKMYRNFKYGTPGPMTRYRLAQYGLTGDVSEENRKVQTLEAIVQPSLRWTGNTASFTGMSKEQATEIADLFDLQLTGEDLGLVDRVKGWFGADDPRARAKTFLLWFKNRFIPVYTAWLSAISAVGEKDLTAVEGLKDDKRKQVFDAVRNIDSEIYSALESPFDPDEKLAGREVAENALILLRNTISGEKKAGTRLQNARLSLYRMGEKAASVVPFPGAGLLAGVMRQQRQQLEAQVAGQGKGGGSLSKSATSLGIMDASKLTPLASIRMRAYGLVDMVQVRVSSLLSLEQAAMESIVTTPDRKTVYEGDADALWVKYAGQFGQQPDDGKAKARWMGWFEDRFLPTLLAQAGAVAVIGTSIPALSPEKALDAVQLMTIAQALIGATDRGRSIWSITGSPWDDGMLNPNQTSVAPYLDQLRATAQKRVSMEKGATAQVKAQAAATAGTVPNEPGAIAKAWNATTSAVGKGFDWVKQQAASVGMNLISPFAKAGAAVSSLFGQDGQAAPGVGQQVASVAPAGGSYSQIPEASNSSIEEMKRIIAHAAKIVGVDPNLLATMAQVESAFRPSIKADGSTATGLFQFIEGTWRDHVRLYGKKYGLPAGADPRDPRANALMGALFTRDNARLLEKRLGRKPTWGEVYQAHFMGPGGAAEFGKLPGNILAGTAMPDAARANPGIFNRGNRPNTVDQVRATLNEKMEKNKVVLDAALLKPIQVAATTQAPQTGGFTSTTANPSGGLGHAPSYVGGDGVERVGGSHPSHAHRPGSSSGGLFSNVVSSSDTHPAGGINETGQVSPRKDFARLKQMFPGVVVSSLARDRVVRGNKKSWHLSGHAGDFVGSIMTDRQQRAQFMAAARAMGYDAIDEGDHVHLEPANGMKPTDHFTMNDAKTLPANDPNYQPQNLPQSRWSTVKQTNKAAGVHPQSIDLDPSYASILGSGHSARMPAPRTTMVNYTPEPEPVALPKPQPPQQVVQAQIRQQAMVDNQMAGVEAILSEQLIVQKDMAASLQDIRAGIQEQRGMTARQADLLARNAAGKSTTGTVTNLAQRSETLPKPPVSTRRTSAA